MVTYTKPNIERKKEAKVWEKWEIRSRLFILDLKDGKLQDLGKQEGGKTFHKLHVLGMKDNLWDRIRGMGSETWKGCK